VCREPRTQGLAVPIIAKVFDRAEIGGAQTGVADAIVARGSGCDPR
jgi:hypothetical protein